MTEKAMIYQLLRDAVITAANLNHKTSDEKDNLPRKWTWTAYASERAYNYINKLFEKEKKQG